jgi:hypothetical protein
MPPISTDLLEPSQQPAFLLHLLHLLEEERIPMQFVFPHARNEATVPRSAAGCLQRFKVLLEMHRYEELRDELARAELAEEILELHVLSFQAILAAAEGSESASDYLEMAEAVATSPSEFAVVAETVAVCELLRANRGAAAKCCLATLDHRGQADGLKLRSDALTTPDRS